MVFALIRPVLGLFARIKARVSPGSYFGLQITAGMLVFVAGAWLFGAIAEDVVTGDPIVALDLAAEHWFYSHQAPWLNRFLSGVSRLHEWRIVAGATILLLIYLLCRRDWRWVIAVICAVPGGMLLDALLKVAFHRARPTLSTLASVLHTYSFPSGHVMAATLLYGVTAAYLTARLAEWHWRVVAVLMAITLIALVAFSRVYLGAHYLSDVLSAAAAGVTWLALVLVAVDTLWYRRGCRPYSIGG
jgi:membrane-associated phospholipid phosphatase